MLPNRNHYRYRYQYRYRLPAIKNRINIFFESIFFVSAPKFFLLPGNFYLFFAISNFPGKSGAMFFCFEWKEGSIKKIAETFKRQLPFQWAWRQWSKCCLFVNFKPAKNVLFRPRPTLPMILQKESTYNYILSIKWPLKGLYIANSVSLHILGLGTTAYT